MRILILSNHQQQPDFRDKYRAIAALGVDLVVATEEPQAGSEAGVRYLPGLIPRGEAGDREATISSKQLRRILSNERPDLVQVEADPDTRLAGTAAHTARAAGLPYVVASRQALEPKVGWLGRRRGVNVLQYAAGVIGESQMAMALLQSRAPNAIAAVIPLAGAPIPPILERGQPADALRVGFVGRLVEERGAIDLVRALGHSYGRWRLIIVGTGPDQENLEREVQQRGLASRVEWWGGIRRETTDRLWPEIDCLAVPSRETPTWVEYHSPLLLEAMGHGIAPIVTRAGCLPDIVGDAGIVVDSLDELTAALQRWVADPRAVRPLGSRARDRILARFVPSAVAAATLEFWHAALSPAVISASEDQGA